MIDRVLRTLLVAMLVTSGATARGAELRVMVSGGMAAAYKPLASAFEKRSRNSLNTIWGSSLGSTPGAIPVRLDHGEAVDVVVMVKDGIAPLIAKGQIDPRSVVDIADSKIAAAVRTGAPVPDIGTVEAFRSTLLKASSIAYSDSASGIYLTSELFKRLGVEEQLAGKLHLVQATPVGESIARGEYELGFQQYSELRPVEGIHIVGLIPEALQKVTVYAAALSSHPQSPAEGRKLIRFLRSPAAYKALEDSGLQPAGKRGKARR